MARPSDRSEASVRPRLRPRSAWLGSLALLVLVAGLYAPVREHAFLHYDDRTFIEENPALQPGLGVDGIRSVFAYRGDGNWIPVTWLTFLVDQELHGLSPAGTHGTSVGLHAIAAVLLFLALRRMTRTALPSVFVAAFFAVHPLHVESVAWAIERKDVLAGVFFHALLWSHAVCAERGGLWRHALSFGLLVLGLLSKSMLVTAPFVLLLLDFWPLDRLRTAAQRRRAVFEKVPMLLAVAAISAITWWTQHGMGATSTEASLPLAARLANAATSYATYLRMTVWPADLSIFYPHPHFRGGVALPSVAAAMAVLTMLTGLALWQWRRRPHLLIGWLWYVGMLVPVIGIVQVGLQAMADRYTYLPLTGIGIAVAWEAAHIARDRPAVRSPLVAGAVLVLAIWTGVARQQLAVWRDGERVFRHAIDVDAENAVAHNGLGVALYEDGRAGEAIGHFRRAAGIQPDFPDAHVNLGVALLETGNPADAIRHLERGRELPANRQARVLGNLGLAEQRLGRTDAAIRHYEEALRLDAGAARIHLNLGALLLETDRREAAERHLRAADQLGLDVPELHFSLAWLTQQRGGSREAVDRYRKALAQRPDWLPALANLASLLARDATVRRPDEAVRLAERAVRASGGTHAGVLETLAAAYEAAGRHEEASKTREQAVRLARAAGNQDEGRESEAGREGRTP